MNFKKEPIAAAALLALLSLSSAVAFAADAPATSAAAKDDAVSEEQKAADANKASRKGPVTKLETVVVTANKRSEAAHKVPYNVSALTEDQLREDNITDIKKLIAQSDAISAPGNSARFADSVTVRGLNVSAVNANNIEQFVRSTLAYYLDDTMLPNIGYRIKDIARVETLLGPQGTLYGAGSLGGTVRYITNKPALGRTEAKLNTSFYQTKYGGISNDTDVVLNKPLGDRVALRASYARLDEKGYTDRISNPPWRTGPYAWTTKPDAQQNIYKDDDWQKVDSGRVALLWKIQPGLELTLSHAQQSQLAHGTSGASKVPVRIANATTPAQIDAAWRLNQSPCAAGSCTYTDSTKTPFIVNDHTILSRYPEFADRKFKLDSVDLDWDLGFARLHSNTSRFEDRREGQADYASQGNAYYNWLPAGDARKTNNSLYMTFDNAFKGVSHETRLSSTGDGPFSWIGGFFYNSQQRNLRFNEVLPGIDQLPAQPAYGFFGIDRKTTGGMTDSGYAEDLGSKYHETALFGEARYQLTDKWTVMGGGRVFNYRDHGTTFIWDYAGGLADTNTTSDTQGKGKSYYKLNTAYQLSSDFLGYFTYSQGFRRGGTNAFRNYPKTNQLIAPDTQAYQPDTTDNYELGLKGFLFDRQLYLQTDVYRIDWNNVQTYYSQILQDPYGVGFPANGTTNGPNARSIGWEFSLRYRLNENWQLSYSTATTSAEWTSTQQRCTYAANNAASDCRVWSKGGKLNGAPKWKHNFGIRYSTTVGDDYDVSASLSGRYTSRIGNDRTDSVSENPPLYYAPYTIYSANIGVYKGNWGVSLWAQNLTDKRAQVSVQSLGDTLMGTRMMYTTPRTLGVNMSYSFK